MLWDSAKLTAKKPPHLALAPERDKNNSSGQWQSLAGCAIQEPV